MSTLLQAQHEQVCEGNTKKLKLRSSQQYRDKLKQELKQDIATYELLNSLCNAFPPQTWSLAAFNQNDLPLVGTRKEKNKISARNSRVRSKAMRAELSRRIHILDQKLLPSF